MRPAGDAPLPADVSLSEAAAQLRRTRYGQLPVVDTAGAYRGVATARALADTLAAPGHEADMVASIVEYPSTVAVTDPLQHTLDALATADGRVPVLDAQHTELVGWLSHQDVLRALSAPPATASPTPASQHG